MYVQLCFNRDGEMLKHWLELPGIGKASMKTLISAAPKATSLEYPEPTAAWRRELRAGRMSRQAINGLFRRRRELQRCDCEPHSGEWDISGQRCETRNQVSLGQPSPKVLSISPQARQLATKPDMISKLDPARQRARARKISQGNYSDLAARLESREPPSKYRHSLWIVHM